jgi:hypothetical protein
MNPPDFDPVGHCTEDSNPISNAISPTADPLGSIESFLNPDSAGGERVSSLPYVWATAARGSMKRRGGFEAVPYAKGIAISAGSAKSDFAWIWEGGNRDRLI